MKQLHKQLPQTTQLLQYKTKSLPNLPFPVFMWICDKHLCNQLHMSAIKRLLGQNLENFPRCVVCCNDRKQRGGHFHISKLFRIFASLFSKSSVIQQPKVTASNHINSIFIKLRQSTFSHNDKQNPTSIQRICSDEPVPLLDSLA